MAVGICGATDSCYLARGFAIELVLIVEDIPMYRPVMDNDCLGFCSGFDESVSIVADFPASKHRGNHNGMFFLIVFSYR